MVSKNSNLDEPKHYIIIYSEYGERRLSIPENADFFDYLKKYHIQLGINNLQEIHIGVIY